MGFHLFSVSSRVYLEHDMPIRTQYTIRTFTRKAVQAWQGVHTNYANIYYTVLLCLFLLFHQDNHYWYMSHSFCGVFIYACEVSFCFCTGVFVLSHSYHTYVHLWSVSGKESVFFSVHNTENLLSYLNWSECMLK